jgi:CRP-like cAMP-binding protein
MSRIEKVLGSGDILFRDGDPSDFVYLIKEGEIEISKGEGTKKGYSLCSRRVIFSERWGLSMEVLAQPRHRQ